MRKERKKVLKATKKYCTKLRALGIAIAYLTSEKDEDPTGKKRMPHYRG